MSTAAKSTAKPRVRMRASLGAQTSSGTAREVHMVDEARGRMMGVHYTGASRVMRELIGWVVQGGDADAALTERPALIERARDLRRNNPIVSGALSTHRVETIGSGLRLQSRANGRVLEGLGIDRELVQKKRQEVENLWQSWAEDARECDLEATKTFYDMQDLLCVTELVQGEAVSVLVQRQRSGSPWLSRLQMMDPQRLSQPDGEPSRSRLAGGVERDGDGAVFAYHFREGHPQSSKIDEMLHRWRRVFRYARTTGRQQVFHTFRADEPSQSRGYPELAPIIHKLKQIDRYSDAEIMAAVVGGMLSVIFSDEGNGDFPNFDEDDDLQEAAKSAGVDTESEMALGHGAILQAPAGMKPTVVSPGRPNAMFDPFYMSVMKQVGVALELPVEVLLGHFSSSYAAARAALLKAWKATVTRRARIERQFCEPVFRSWLYEAVALGQIELPGFMEDPRARWAWSRSKWIGPARGAIDPLKEYGSELLLHDALIRPRADIAQQLTGADWHDSIDSIEEEERALVAAGLRPGRPTAPGAQAEPQAPEPEGQHQGLPLNDPDDD